MATEVHERPAPDGPPADRARRAVRCSSGTAGGSRGTSHDDLVEVNHRRLASIDKPRLAAGQIPTEGGLRSHRYCLPRPNVLFIRSCLIATLILRDLPQILRLERVIQWLPARDPRSEVFVGFARRVSAGCRSGEGRWKIAA